MKSISSECKVAVTGCSGFIGSNLVDYLLNEGYEVIGIDNLSSGKIQFLESATSNSRFKFYEVDILKHSRLEDVIDSCEIIFHLSANADVKGGPANPTVDFEKNTRATQIVLEAMRKANIKKIVFSSTGSIYGEALVVPTPENAPFPIQTSLYGASKLACEGMISAYCESFEFQAWIFRFVSILGPRYTHGHVFDFYKQLIEDSGSLEVLGNGNQKKSYLHVLDCISGIEFGMKNFKDRVNVINLGHTGYISVKESINYITREMNVNPAIKYGSEDRGWIGDNPFIFLDTNKMNSFGWAPKFSIERGVIDTVRYLSENTWLITENDQSSR
jgi:UDP-glucose 4-epimerase